MTLHVYRGSEWGHLDNTKHLIFWLCNMKQLNFKHFNINSKKFTVTVNFSQKDTKTAPKRPILFCLVYQEEEVILRRFPIISEDFLRLPKIPEDCRRFPKTTEDVCILPKISEEKSENFRLYFVVIFTCERYIFTVQRYDFFSERNPCNSL